jgi:23S rRNA pseudouridine1911/1915/1917 synthase
MQESTPAASASRPIAFSVTESTELRLDRFLAEQLQWSRTQSARLIARKAVRVNGAVARASRLLVRGDRVTVELPEAEPPRTIQPAAIPLRIVFEDEHLAVIDKPAGLVVHPAPGHWQDTLVNALVARGTTLSGGAAGRPGIVHRLDRDTSGLLLVAKTDLAHRRLGAALAARRISRHYAGLIWGHLARSPLVIDAPIGRHPRDRKRMTVTPDGRPARTDAYVVARFALTELVRLELHSGRTHQVRVHLAHVGHPLVGDPIYGEGGSRRVTASLRRDAEAIERVTPRQALHAAYLGLQHPISGEPLEFRSEWPADLVPAMALAAGPEIPVAHSDCLRYLLFFKAHG